MLDLNENILAIDIGKGTEDIYFYQPHQRLENGVHIIKNVLTAILKVNVCVIFLFVDEIQDSLKKNRG